MNAFGARELSTLGSHVPEGALIVAGQGVGEPTVALDCLFESVPSARLLIGMPMTDVLDRAPAHLELLSFLAMGPNGRLVQEGRMQLLPMHLGDLGPAFATPTLRPDVVVVLASPPDAEGNCWLGIESDYLWSALQHDPVVLAELNEHVPVVAGDTCIPRGRIAAAVSSSRPLPEVPAAMPSALDLAIAERILPFVENGTCLQLGIGRQAEAVLQGLGDRRDLGFHSGMIGDTVFDLISAGIVNNRRKTVDRGLTVAGTLHGTRACVAAASSDPTFRLRSIDHTHATATLSALDQFLSVNGAIEVDLLGQVNAETAGGRPVGGTGGHVDFVRGSRAAPGGRSIVALPSTARAGASRIVPRVETVTALAADVDVIVTEHGVAELRGRSMDARAEQLVALAAPEHREALVAAWRRSV